MKLARLASVIVGLFALAVATFLNIRPMASEFGQEYPFWDYELIAGVGMALLSGFCLSPQSWKYAVPGIIAFVLLVRVLTYNVLDY